MKARIIDGKEKISMDASAIAFPHLGIYLGNVPKSFTVFGFTIALYGVVIAAGMAAGLAVALHVAKKYGYDTELIWDFFLYGIIFGLIGARLYYVIFSWENYKDDLLSIFNTRNGGMAIYGGVIAAFITLFVFCKVKKIRYFTMIDICVPGLALGQAIGRWGNFFNREAFGQYTDSLLAMRLPIAAVRPHEISESISRHIIEGTNYIQVHPTFLYECLWNVALIAIMLLVWRRKKFEGQIALIYLGGYGLGRAMIESLRTDQLHLPGTQIPVSQLLAGLLVLFSAIAYGAALARKRGKAGEDTKTMQK